VLSQINMPGSETAEQASLYRLGELGDAEAVERITRAILNLRGWGDEGWWRHASAVEAALTHPLACECEQCW
jgi:hypothetical protein